MNRSIDFRQSYTAVLIFGIAMAVMEYFSPRCLDTYIFMCELRNTNPDGYTLSGLFDYFNNLRLNDNLRVLNVLAPFFHLYVPQWLYALFIGFCCGLTLWVALKFAGFRQGEGMLGFYMLWALVAFLPWNNNLLVQVYSLNYIVPAAICMVAIRLLSKGTRRATWWGSVLAVFGGMCHEAIGVTLACGAVLMWMRFRDKRYRAFYVALLVASAVSVLWMSLSHLTLRLGEREISQPAFLFMPKYWLIYNCLTVGLICLVGVAGCFGSTRRRLVKFVEENPYSLFFFGTAVGGFVLAGAVSLVPRTGYWPQLCAAVVWGIILLPLLRRRLRAAKIVGGVLAAAFIVFAVWSGALCRKLCEAYNDAEAQIESSPTGTVFADTLHPCDFPPLVTRFTIKGIFCEFFNYIVLSEYHTPKRVAFIPTELRDRPTDVTPDSLMRSKSGYFYYRPSLPAPWERLAPPGRGFVCYALNIKAIDVRGEHAVLPALYLPYVAPDGTQMVMVEPVFVHPLQVRELDFDPKNPDGLEEYFKK